METESTKQNIQAIKEIFKNIRDTLARDKINEIRTNIYKKETILDFLTNKDKLKSNEQKVLIRINDYFNKLYDDLLKKSKYENNFMYGLEKLFNSDVYYNPIEVKSAFNGDYVYYESNGDKISSVSVLEYFSHIIPFLHDLIEYFKTNGEWKIQLSMRIKFISITDAAQENILHSKSDNVEIMRGIDTKTIIDELIDTFMKRYQEGLEAKMNGSNYVYERVVLLEYHFHKVTLKRGSSYIPSRKWLINKKSTLGPHNKDDN